MSYTLYSYWRSSASYRVRIALNLKGIAYDYKPINLLKAEHHSDNYREINPSGLVPTLRVGERYLAQSLAIIDYIESAHPTPSLLPEDPIDQAWVKQIAQIVACEIHPLDNLSVLQYLVNELDVSQDDKLRWYQHWIIRGFSTIERLLDEANSELFCFGNTPTLADIALIPQVYNAERFESDMSSFPRISKINAHCLSLKAFAAAAPEKQIDAL